MRAPIIHELDMFLEPGAVATPPDFAVRDTINYRIVDSEGVPYTHKPTMSAVVESVSWRMGKDPAQAVGGSSEWQPERTAEFSDAEHQAAIALMRCPICGSAPGAWCVFGVGKKPYDQKVYPGYAHARRVSRSRQQVAALALSALRFEAEDASDEAST
jgi:hypothetical protein